MGKNSLIYEWGCRSNGHIFLNTWFKKMLIDHCGLSRKEGVLFEFTKLCRYRVRVKEGFD